MAISLVGSNSAESTTVAIPAHQAGDLLIISARRANNTAATTPTGWTNIQTGGANTLSLKTAYRVATGAGTDSGTWSNAQHLIVSVWRSDAGTLSIGESSVLNNNSNSNMPYPALTLQDSSGSSAVYRVGARGGSTGVTQVGNPPPDYTFIESSPFLLPLVAAHQRMAVSSNPTADNVSMGSNAAHRAHSIEIVETIPPTDPHIVDSVGTYVFASSITLDVPAGVQDGDFLVTFLHSRSIRTLTGPASGWDPLFGPDTSGLIRVWGYIREAASEPSSYTWTFDNLQHHIGVVVAVRNVAGINAGGTTNGTTASTSLDISSISPGVANCLLLGLYGCRQDTDPGAQALTHPAGMLGLQDVTGEFIIKSGASYSTELPTGATGTRTVSYPNSADWRGVLLALEPSAAGEVLNLSGSATSTSSTTARIVADYPVIGAAQSSSTATARMAAEMPLSGSAASLSTTAGFLALAQILALSGSATSATATNARMVASLVVQGGAVSESGTTARFVAELPLFGSAASTSSTVGELLIVEGDKTFDWPAVFHLTHVPVLSIITHLPALHVATDLPVITQATAIDSADITTDVVLPTVATSVIGLAVSTQVVGTAVSTDLPDMTNGWELPEEG